MCNNIGATAQTPVDNCSKLLETASCNCCCSAVSCGFMRSSPGRLPPPPGPPQQAPQARTGGA
eukprot:9596539-Alexandrium_andersonii.AAC.1